MPDKSKAKSKRHLFYVAALAELENPKLIGFEYRHAGFCHYFNHAFDLMIYGDGNFKRRLPELFAKVGLPTNKHMYYWKSWNQRLDALRECIIETAN